MVYSQGYGVYHNDPPSACLFLIFKTECEATIKRKIGKMKIIIYIICLFAVAVALFDVKTFDLFYLLVLLLFSFWFPYLTLFIWLFWFPYFALFIWLSFLFLLFVICNFVFAFLFFVILLCLGASVFGIVRFLSLSLFSEQAYVCFYSGFVEGIVEP